MGRAKPCLIQHFSQHCVSILNSLRLCLLKNNHRKTMNIETFSKMRALLEASTEGNQRLIDHFLDGEQGDELRAEMKLKRIQFDTHSVLFDKLEDTCILLDCSKRVFLEMAVIEAIQKANATFFETYETETGSEYGTRTWVAADGTVEKVPQ